MKTHVWLFLVLAVLVSGCTHWSHSPPVPLDQHKSDLRECLGIARLPHPLIVGLTESTPINTAITGVGFAATIAEEVQFERRLEACMTARGYRRAGLTTNIYGWTNP